MVVKSFIFSDHLLKCYCCSSLFLYRIYSYTAVIASYLFTQEYFHSKLSTINTMTMLYVDRYMLQIIDATLVFSSWDKIKIHIKHIPHMFLMKKRPLHFHNWKYYIFETFFSITFVCLSLTIQEKIVMDQRKMIRISSYVSNICISRVWNFHYSKCITMYFRIIYVITDFPVHFTECV